MKKLLESIESTSVKTDTPELLAKLQKRDCQSLFNDYLNEKLIFVKNERVMKCILATIIQVLPEFVVVSYDTYNSNGEHRGKLNTTMSYSSFICGDIRIVGVNKYSW